MSLSGVRLLAASIPFCKSALDLTFLSFPLGIGHVAPTSVASASVQNNFSSFLAEGSEADLKNIFPPPSPVATTNSRETLVSRESVNCAVDHPPQSTPRKLQRRKLHLPGWLGETSALKVR